MKKQIERRITDAKITVRSNDDGTVGVRGYAAVFDTPAFGEVITRSAFNRTIAQKDNVRFLINHEGVPLASTRAGTMTIGVDDVGQWFDIPSLDPTNPRVAEFCSAVGRGDMYQCSFAGYFRDAPLVDGLREVREVELVDNSGVTYPWYEETSMSLTGDRALDGQLVSARSLKDLPSLTDDQRANVLRVMRRAAPPGKTSYGDQQNALWDAIEEMIRNETGSLDAWCYIDDWGSDWAVYRIFDYTTYEYGPFMQVSWKQNSDGTFKLGTPFPVERITEYRPVVVAQDTAVKSLTVAEARALLVLIPAA